MVVCQVGVRSRLSGPKLTSADLFQRKTGEETGVAIEASFHAVSKYFEHSYPIALLDAVKRMKIRFPEFLPSACDSGYFVEDLHIYAHIRCHHVFHHWFVVPNGTADFTGST